MGILVITLSINPRPSSALKLKPLGLIIGSRFDSAGENQNASNYRHDRRADKRRYGYDRNTRCNHGNVEKIMIYFAFIVVRVSSFFVFDCNNVKSSIKKVNVMRQKHLKHQHIQSDRDSFLYDKFHGTFVYRNGPNYRNGPLKLT